MESATHGSHVSTMFASGDALAMTDSERLIRHICIVMAGIEDDPAEYGEEEREFNLRRLRRMIVKEQITQRYITHWE